MRHHLGVQVESSDGTWHVRRRWAPRHLGADTAFERFRRRVRTVRDRKPGDDGATAGCLLDVISAASITAAVVALVIVLLAVGFPFLVALGELVFVLLLAVGGVVGRVLFRRPWTIDAVSPDGDHHVWDVVGWRASGDAEAFIADRLRTTGEVPTSEEIEAATLTS